MPASRGGLPQRLRPSRSGRRTACRRARGAGSGTRRRGDAGQRHLGVGRPGQREVACPGRAARRRRTSARARSRRCRRRRGCARAARGGRRGCARWRSPGSTTPGSRSSSAPGRLPGVDGGEPAVVDLEQDAARDARQQRVGRASAALARSTPSSRPAPRPRAASASTPARQSSALGVLRRRVRDPGRVADEQHRRRHAGRGRACRRRARRRWPAPAPGRPSAPARPGRRRSPASNAVSAVQDSSSGSTPRLRADVGDDRAHGAARRRRGRPASRHPRRDRVDAVGLDRAPCRTVASAPVRAAAAARAARTAAA